MPSASAPSASIPVRASPPSTGQRSPSERISRSASSPRGAPRRAAARPRPRGVLVARIIDDSQLELATPDSPFGIDLVDRQLGGPEHRGSTRLGEGAREADGNRPRWAGAGRYRDDGAEEK